jgi:hypothetical protein
MRFWGKVVALAFVAGLGAAAAAFWALGWL